MVATPSTMLPLGTRIPSFSLVDAVSGRTVTDQDLNGSPSLVMFVCNHCPFVKHVVNELGRLGEDYASRGVRIAAINSNDVEMYPQDNPQQMRGLAVELGWSFPFLHDTTQQVAKDFRAACTPDFYVFDAEGRLAYRGQLDDSRPSNDIPVSGRDIRAALDAALAGATPPAEQLPSLGCNIKWKPGNEPPYFPR